MHPSIEILRLQRDREVIAQFRRKFHAEMAAFAFRLSLVRLAQSQDYQRRFDPAQPHDENGRWTAIGGGGTVGGAQLAQAASSSSTMTDAQEEPLLGGPIAEGETPELAQARMPRRLYPSATQADLYRLDSAYARASAASSYAGRIDPDYRPTPGAYSGIGGHIRQLEAEAAEAEAFVMRHLGGSNSSTLSSSLRSDILRGATHFVENSQPVGWRYKRADDGILTLPVQEFWQRQGQALFGAQPIAGRPTYPGNQFRLLDGSDVGVRQSQKTNLPAFEILSSPNPLFRPNMNWHSDVP